MIRAGVCVVAVMGVSGAGKTTVGHALAARLGWAFQDADALHPPANVAKMAAGHALTDADRVPWLAALRDWVAARLDTCGPGVLACSLLKRAYRRQVLGDEPRVALVFLTAAPAVLRARMAHRVGHFMPESLLDSQLQALEPPAADEHPVVVDVGGNVEQTVDAALSALAAA